MSLPKRACMRSCVCIEAGFTKTNNRIIQQPKQVFSECLLPYFRVVFRLVYLSQWQLVVLHTNFNFLRTRLIFFFFFLLSISSEYVLMRSPARIRNFPSKDVSRFPRYHWILTSRPMTRQKIILEFHFNSLSLSLTTRVSILREDEITRFEFCFCKSKHARHTPMLYFDPLIR